MNDKTLKVLEFDKILNMLQEKAVSKMGKEMAANLRPSVFLSEITDNLQETTEAVKMIFKKGQLPLGGIKDIRSSLKRAAIGGVLSVSELMHVGEFLYVCRKVSKYAQNDSKREYYDRLDPMFDSIAVITSLETEINRCIINENEIADDASPALRTIRNGIKTSNSKINEHLNSIIHSSTYKNMLQDPVITIRNGRYCVPVKAEHRNSFSGMIHDQSSTGATLFMEPISVVNLNNKIKELTAEEGEEINRILSKLSGLTAEQEPVLSANLNVLTHLDFVFAKGELSISMGATEPIMNTKGVINIMKGRHPLLSKDIVVPIDVYLGDKFRTLLITGPNTGGKTVSLKTVGLFTIMGQAGLHIPALDNSKLAVFDNVFADIGDEQSIEQSLSTFSGHMKNIVSILSEITENSLVLLDELGAGTDPTEGAALAIAIVSYLFDIGARTAVTTHYSELKVYALSTEGVENASCEFDVETLRPTYRLLTGIPGKSNAFAISKRLGLPDHIISAAKEALSHEDERFEDVITDLEISKKSVIIEQERASQFRRDAEKLKADYEKQKEKLDAKREKLLADAKKEARMLLEDAKSEADKILKEIQKLYSAKASYREIDEKRIELKRKLDSINADIQDSAPKKEIRPVTRALVPGDKVFIHSMEQTGSVLSSPDNSGKFMVQLGIMKVSVNLKDVSLDETEEKEIKHKISATGAKAKKALNISSELDLRGLMVTEAIAKTEKYLDDAYLANMGQVGIIHGKGTGALRSAIQSYLKGHPHVKSFRFGGFGEGDLGVTIVELKQ